jgi:putative ABC transport system permease protein
VAPIEALRPLRAPSLATPPGRHRFLWSVVCVLVGMVLLFGGLIMTHQLVELPTSLDYQFFAGVVTGTLGGALVALGLIMGAVFWIPKVVGAVARVLARAGSPARMAAANLVRNPRRTAATVTALLVGVTLVSGLIVTASSLERTLSARIDTGVPVDVQVGHPFGGWFYPSEIDWTRDYLADQSLETGVVERLRAVEGVEAVAVIGEAMVAIPNDEGEPIYYLVAVTDPDALANAINLPEAEVPLAEGVILVSDSMNWMISNPEGDPAATYTFADKDEAWGAGASDPSGSLAPLAEVDGTSREVWAVADSGDDAGDGGDGIGGDSAEILFLYSPLLDQFSASMMMDQATLEQLGGEAQVNAVWLKIARSSDALAVEESIAEIVSGASTGDYAAPVVSEAVRRAETHKAIDTMVLIGLALLAAAVVVALIGVSNTLSLSVIERRHELALLRALGLTRGQTRWMLAVEGAAIATVAGLMGVLLGTGFAFAATSLVMGPFEGSIWAVPWGRLALVLGLAVVTGFAASALPGRRAAKTAPSRALAQI